MGFWSKVGGAGKKAAGAPVSQAKKLIGYEDAKQNWSWMTGLARGLLPSSIKAGRIETFEHAMARQDVTQEDLGRIFTNHVLRFWICAMLFLAGIGVGASYIMGGSALFVLPVLGFSAVCLSQMFSASFRAHQIAIRRFCDVSEWISRRDVWFPISFTIPAAPVKKPLPAGRSIVVKKSDAKPPRTKE